MAITLIATAGATNANTYPTLAEAETYFESRIAIAAWAAATDPNKNISLSMATRLIDQQVLFRGWMYDSDQSLQWPRRGVMGRTGNYLTDNTIPQFLKDATSEYAALLLTEDRTIESGTKGYDRISVADAIYVRFDKYDRKKVMPPSVWSFLKFYGSRIGAHRRLVRV